MKGKKEREKALLLLVNLSFEKINKQEQKKQVKSYLSIFSLSL
jgi:hypothetical protein